MHTNENMWYFGLLSPANSHGIFASNTHPIGPPTAQAYIWQLAPYEWYFA
jgi:hypothetical protein